MVDIHQSDSLVMSSACPYSCALVKFALKLGGTIDPAFLIQCRIADSKLQKAINELKPIPLKFETPSTCFGYQEDIFLDMDALNAREFYDPWDFKEYNSWIGTSEQWNSTYTVHRDIIVDLI